MSFRPGRHPLAGALLFQSAIVAVAMVLAWLFGLSLLGNMHWNPAVLYQVALATVPLVLLLPLFTRIDRPWICDITGLIERFLELLFRQAPLGSVLLVSLLAGIGEELLFRGVIQAGLAGPVGTLPALLLASLLFGLAHAISPAYFVLATLMGLYLGWLYLATGNLLVVILVHALYDWVAIHYYLHRSRRDDAHQA